MTPGSRLSLALGCLALLLVLAPAAGAGTIKDPHAIGCPSAPPGWTNPAGEGGKTVLDAGTNSRVSAQDVEVTCDYFAKKGESKHLMVAVAYALPSDINPNNDFFWGCGSTGTKWNETDRVYRLPSRDTWALADFADSGNELTARDEPAFESVAQQLLQNTEGYAHRCNVKISPTQLTSDFTYDFSSAAGTGSGQFKTTGVVVKAGAVPVVSTTASTSTLKLAGHFLTVAVRHGIRLYPARTKQKAKLLLAVSVVHSTLPSCASGNNGTLVLTETSLELRVCSRRFSGGKTITHINFI